MFSLRNKRWSPEEDARLRELFVAGLSPPRLAIRLKRTQRAVEARIVALKLRQLRAAPVGIDTAQAVPAK